MKVIFENDFKKLLMFAYIAYFVAIALKVFSKSTMNNI